MKAHRFTFFMLLSSCTVAFSAFARQAEQSLTRPIGFYGSVFYSSFHDPIFRGPGESGEVSVPQIRSAVGFNLSYLYLSDDVGGGISFVYWRTQFDSFQAPVMPGSPDNVAYKNPDYSVFFVDLQFHVLPWKIPLSFYGVLGLGSSTETYTISGAKFPFADWNGPKSISQFQYSYGLGIQVFLFRNVSLQTELRWIPGDLTTEYTDYLYSKDGYDYFGSADQRTDHHVKIFSVGLSVGGLW